MTNPRSTCENLLDTADLLLAGDLGATPAGRHRGAALALRTALEIAVTRAVSRILPEDTRTTARARMLCLRFCVEPETARRAKAVWAHLCLGCHYHQYEIGPTRGQVLAWREEVEELVREISP